VSKAQQDIRRKTRALEHAARTGNIRQTCRYFGIPRSLFYVWNRAYEREGEAGLVNKKPVARFHPKTCFTLLSAACSAWLAIVSMNRFRSSSRRGLGTSAAAPH
jgi:transposase-like protein